MSLDLDQDAAASLLKVHYGVEGHGFRRYGAELATVFRVETASGSLAFKAMAVSEHRREVIDWHVQLMDMAREAELPVARTIPGATGPIECVNTPYGEVFMHLSEWLPGTPLMEWPRSRPMLAEVGRMAGVMSRAFNEAPPPPVDIAHRWRLERTLEVIESCLPAIGDTSERELVIRAQDLVSSTLQPMIDTLPKSVVHHDLHDSNLLFLASEVGAVPSLSGILDFGDAVLGVRVAELAVAGGYASRQTPKPDESLLAVVAGWCDVTTLTEAEAAAVLPAAIGRLAVNLAQWRALSQDRGDDYSHSRADSSAAALFGLLEARESGLTDQVMTVASQSVRCWNDDTRVNQVESGVWR